MQPREDGACGSDRLESPAVRVEAKCLRTLEDLREAFPVDVAQVPAAVDQGLPRLSLGEAAADEVVEQFLV